MPACVPIKDLKNTAAFSQMIEESAGPVVVAKNGYDAFVVMRTDDYEAMQLEISKARLLSRIADAEREYSDGLFVDGDSCLSGLREKYGL